jgi:hypothetical protein
MFYFSIRLLEMFRQRGMFCFSIRLLEMFRQRGMFCFLFHFYDFPQHFSV